MGYRKVGCLEQIWYVIKYGFRSWREWRLAKAWAKAAHPAWVDIVRRAKSEETRRMYRGKILKAYRGELLYADEN